MPPHHPRRPNLPQLPPTLLLGEEGELSLSIDAQNSVPDHSPQVPAAMQEAEVEVVVRVVHNIVEAPGVVRGVVEDIIPDQGPPTTVRYNRQTP